MRSKGIFILAITWIVISLFWFWAENIALGIIWLCGGVIELFIALVRRSKEKKSKYIPVCRIKKIGRSISLQVRFIRK